MRPVRATQLWVVGLLVSCVATAFVAKLAKAWWPELRAESWAWFAAPGVALAFVLLLLLRKHLVARAKRATHHLDRG